MKFDTLEKVLEKFRVGEFVIVYDETREEEGDFFLLAENATPEKINFLLKKARGMICVACSSEILDRLELPIMFENNENPHGTNFCVSVDAKEGVTTGVSAFDRSKVIKLFADPATIADNFVRPGHTFPLRAEKDFDKRFGHTESAVAMAQKCEKTPAVVICEILNEEGGKATGVELQTIAQEFDMPIITLESLKKLS